MDFLKIKNKSNLNIPIVQKIVVRTDLNMRKGKLASQVAHASNEVIFTLYNLTNQYFLICKYNKKIIQTDAYLSTVIDEYIKYKTIIEEWWNTGKTKIVLGCESEDDLRELIDTSKQMKILCFPIIDSGKTEFHGIPTLTCCSFGPYFKDELDKFTDKLRLI